jgi:uncharacterized membrane protein
MAQYVCDIVVDAPVGRVFEVWADLANAADRIDGIKSLRVLTDGPAGVGTRFSETRIMFKKEATEEMEITIFEPGVRYVVEADSCGSKWVTEMRFDAEGDGTKVTTTMNCEPGSTFAKVTSAIMAPMMKGMMLKCVRGDMNDLKRYIESSG